MRAEKQYLLDEVTSYLEKSDHVIITNYERINSVEVAEIRSSLRDLGAEFHVVKNRILNVSLKEQNKPDISEHLTGQTAIVVGGEDVSGVIKVLKKFHKGKDKNEIKVGILGDKQLSKDELNALAELPSLEVLRATFLGLLTQPATSMVSVLAASPRSILYVLKAKAEKGE
jgi:large subunit ribosomal protein L10